MQPVNLLLADKQFTLRRAEETDLDAIIQLLADDPMRSPVESTAPETRPSYERAFRSVNADPDQLLIAVADEALTVVATMQLTQITALSRAGATRVQVEAVRVRTDLTGNGLGGAMLEWAVTEAQRRGATLVQLTSDRERTDAHRFYARLGFTASHIGFRMLLK